LDVAGAHFSWALDSSGVQINWTLDFLRAQIGLGLGLGQRVNRPIHSFSSFPFFFLFRPSLLFGPNPFLLVDFSTLCTIFSLFSSFSLVLLLFLFLPSFFLLFSFSRGLMVEMAGGGVEETGVVAGHG
jgi:hypothetical protein